MRKKHLVIIVVMIVVLSIISVSIIGAIILNPSKPKAKIIASTSYAFVNETIQFDGSKSKGDIVSWIWDFGDGEISEKNKTNHTFNRSAYFDVSLTITDKNGKTDIAFQNISIQNEDYHGEKSGTDLYVVLSRGDDWDRFFFPVFEGITKPIIYANWSGSAKYADIIVGFASPHSEYFYVEQIYCMNNEFNINLIVDKSYILEFGDYLIAIRVEQGKIDDYFMEVDVHY